MFDDRAIAREGTKLFTTDNQEMGIVTSGSFSPSLQKSIAMGYVDYDYMELGAELEAEIRNRRHPGKIVKLPFVERKYYRG